MARYGTLPGAWCLVLGALCPAPAATHLSRSIFIKNKQQAVEMKMESAQLEREVNRFPSVYLICALPAEGVKSLQIMNESLIVGK